MWIESTIDEIIQVVKRFLITFVDTIFRPGRVFQGLKSEEGAKYLRPSTYCFLSLIIYITFTRAALAMTVYVRQSKFVTWDSLKSAITNIPSSFNLNAFLYAFPVFVLGYAVLILSVRYLGLTQLWKDRFVSYVFLWAGSAFFIYMILCYSVATIPLVCSLLHIDSYAEMGNIYNTVNTIVQRGIYVIASIPPLIAVIKNVKEYPRFRLLVIPLIVAFSVDYVYFSEHFLWKGLGPARNPIVLKGSFFSDWLTVQVPTDTTSGLLPKFDVLLVNESDSIFILPKGDTLKLYKYPDKTLSKTDDGKSLSADDMEAVKSQVPFIFHLSSIENVTDSFLVLKPGDIKRVTFSLNQWPWIGTKRPTTLQPLRLGLAELTLYSTTMHTNAWEQFWVNRKITQVLTFGDPY